MIIIKNESIYGMYDDLLTLILICMFIARLINENILLLFIL